MYTRLGLLYKCTFYERSILHVYRGTPPMPDPKPPGRKMYLPDHTDPRGHGRYHVLDHENMRFMRGPAADLEPPDLTPPTVWISVRGRALIDGDDNAAVSDMHRLRIAAEKVGLLLAQVPLDRSRPYTHSTLPRAGMDEVEYAVRRNPGVTMQTLAQIVYHPDTSSEKTALRRTKVLVTKLIEDLRLERRYTTGGIAIFYLWGDPQVKHLLKSRREALASFGDSGAPLELTDAEKLTTALRAFRATETKNEPLRTALARVIAALQTPEPKQNPSLQPTPK